MSSMQDVHASSSSRFILELGPQMWPSLNSTTSEARDGKIGFAACAVIGKAVTDKSSNWRAEMLEKGTVTVRFTLHNPSQFCTTWQN